MVEILDERFLAKDKNKHTQQINHEGNNRKD
jgi:hypothetical protein